MPWDTFFVDLLSALPCRTSPHTKFVQLKLHTMPKCGSEAVFSSVFFFSSKPDSSTVLERVIAG
jgi:hypothetical protein